jgi:sterol desaturase/sphingolipid hydroxylase (fatty acid hydroxylase superfamily)
MHHSRKVHETNSNYANLLTVYDRMFGTYTPSERAASVEYGWDTADAGKVASFRGLLTMPFERTLSSIPDRKVRIEPGVAR